MFLFFKQDPNDEISGTGAGIAFDSNLEAYARLILPLEPAVSDRQLLRQPETKSTYTCLV